MNVRLMLWIGFWIYIFSGCSQNTVQMDRPQTSPSSRFAQAILRPQAGLFTQGQFRFEQMPNSIIVTYRLEGLKAKQFYQISASPKNDCSVLEKKNVGTVLYQFIGNKTGASESTFKNEDFSLSANNPLIGHSLILSQIDKKGGTQIRAILGCGLVEAASAKTDLTSPENP